MKPFEKCPVCGGDLVKKEVEKLLKGGNNTAVLTVTAEICLQCGERLYLAGDIRRFEKIRRKLKTQDVADFQLLGQNYQAA